MRLRHTGALKSARGAAVYLVLLFFVVVVEAADSPVPWGSLTAEQLSSLEPSNFRAITESELASIPPEVRPILHTKCILQASALLLRHKISLPLIGRQYCFHFLDISY